MTLPPRLPSPLFFHKRLYLLGVILLMVVVVFVGSLGGGFEWLGVFLLDRIEERRGEERG